MNTITNTVEDLVVAIVTKIRDIVQPIFSKYAMYYKYIEIFLYASYAIILLGFYKYDSRVYPPIAKYDIICSRLCSFTSF